jgi:hypothetical protein
MIATFAFYEVGIGPNALQSRKEFPGTRPSIEERSAEEYSADRALDS